MKSCAEAERERVMRKRESKRESKRARSCRHKMAGGRVGRWEGGMEVRESSREQE